VNNEVSHLDMPRWFSLLSKRWKRHTTFMSNWDIDGILHEIGQRIQRSSLFMKNFFIDPNKIQN